MPRPNRPNRPTTQNTPHREQKVKLLVPNLEQILGIQFHRRVSGEVKDAFDPRGLLNPGRVVRAPRMDDRTLFRYAPDYAADPKVAPVLDWSPWPGPQGGLLGAVEM